jgi:hypothetical protein
MAWRETLLRNFGPGLLGGVTFGRWMRLLAENRFAVHPRFWLRAGAITSQSFQNTLFHWFDQRQLGDELRNVEVPPPLFLLGHWRQGTTHLHYLLTIDKRFAFPNNYQTLYPLSFLTAERLHSPAVDFFLPKRRPMDNVEWTMQSPQEDEFALCIETFMSPCMGWAFPKRREYYERYLTMRGVADEEIAAWKAAFDRYVRKLTWKLKAPLVLKSPPHTCRIKLLLELFPTAKFLHICRNPFDVFPSSRKTFDTAFQLHRLQRHREDEVDDWILQRYASMYDAYFEERSLIPSGRLHEVRYEDLERDPIREVRAIYESLDLPDYAVVELPLRHYVDSIASYEKNSYAELPGALRDRITHQWRRTIAAWGYG